MLMKFFQRLHQALWTTARHARVWVHACVWVCRYRLKQTANLHPCPRRLPNASAILNMAATSVSTAMEHTFRQPRWPGRSFDSIFFFFLCRKTLLFHCSRSSGVRSRCERKAKPETREVPGPCTPVWARVHTHPSALSHSNAATLSSGWREINR